MIRNRDRRGGQAIFLVVLCSTFFFSLAGMATDFIWAYVIKQRLTTAVDAASLAAVRALGRGATDMNRIVGLVFESNFPEGFLLAKNVRYDAPSITTPEPGIRNVELSGRATAPTFFMRIWGVNALEVRSGATASRRDVNLVLVLDRSASLHPMNADAWDDVQQASSYFVEQFDDSRDRLGLVTFGTSAAADVPLGLNNKTTISSTIANQVVAASAATNSPQGLWLAYAEMLRVSDPYPVNAIVFFTDGQPSAYTATFDVRRSPASGSSSAPYCNSSSKEAVLGALQSGPDFYEISGFWNRTATTPVSIGNYFGTTYDTFVVSGCDNNQHNFAPFAADVELIFSSSCLPTSWTASHGGISRTFSITSGPYTVNQCSSLLKSTSTNWSNRVYRGTQVHNASKNLTVNIANAARSNLSLGEVRIYSIGLGGWGYPADADFLERVSNDADSDYYDSSQPAGLYFYSPSPLQLTQAFNQVASEIFRLLR